MPMCKFFLTGNCRFGSKCNNDHLDLKQIITNEVQATLKGKQWPLSCFGPFKEKKNIPNFIGDVSFEECRFDAYEARSQNNFQNHVHNFNKQVQDAQNKMNALLMLNKTIIDLIVSLYDEDSQNTQKSGPFSMSSNSFDSAALGAGSASTSSFVNSNSTPPSSGIFGSGGGAFGMTNSSISQGSNVFGSGALKQSSFVQQPSMFASSQSQMQGNHFASGFGQGQTSTQQGSGGSIFSKPGSTTTSMFGSSAASVNPFGSSTTSSNGSSFGGQPSIFGQSNPQTQGSMFGVQTQQNVPPQANVIFGNQNNPQQSVFGNQPNIFGQPQQAQTSVSGGGIFSQQTQQLTPSSFGSTPFPVQQPAASQQITAFAQPSVFAQPQQQASSFGQTQQIIQTPVTQQTSFFGQQQVTQQPQAAMNPSAFGMQQGPQPNSFIQQPQQSQVVLNGTEYSKMEDLSPEDLAQFQNGKFEEGKIPLVPPPKELCSAWTF